MMEAVRTSETSVDNDFTRQYIPEDNSEHHTRLRENLKSHSTKVFEPIWILLIFGLQLYDCLQNSTGKSRNVLLGKTMVLDFVHRMMF
jgi:hypothetical protein